jgi:hypothetical protein
MAAKTLTRWVELGLFQEEGERREVALAPDVGPEARDPGRLPDVLRRLVFRRDNNERFWEAESARSADFSRAVAWLLAQDVHALHGWDRHKIDTLQGEQFADGLIVIQNISTRWPGLQAWAGYLGFAWTAGYPRSGSLRVDPTEAARAGLPAVFGGAAEELTQDVFLDRLAAELPVLDGGDYRREVEAKLRPERWKAPPADAVSVSLSVALERLRLDGTLVFRDADDPRFGRRRLLGAGGRPLTQRSFTHVRLGRQAS